MKKHKLGRHKLALKRETVQVLASRTLEKAAGGVPVGTSEASCYTCISQDYECFPQPSVEVDC